MHRHGNNHCHNHGYDNAHCDETKQTKQLRVAHFSKNLNYYNNFTEEEMDALILSLQNISLQDNPKTIIICYRPIFNKDNTVSQYMIRETVEIDPVSYTHLTLPTIYSV